MDILNTDFGGDSFHRGKIIARDNFNGDVVAVEIIDDFGSVTAKFVFQ